MTKTVGARSLRKEQPVLKQCMNVLARLLAVLKTLVGVVEIAQALMWLAVTWQQWLPRHWMSWPRAGEMWDGMAVASMFAAALAASVVHAVAALCPAVQRFCFLGW